MLNEQILLLSKKHGQLKQATTKMVQVAMSFIDEAPDAEKKLALIETLRTVTEGKVRLLKNRFGKLFSLSTDICRSRTSACHANLVRYEEVTG